MLIDTHSHIYSEEFIGEREEVVQRSIDNGIEKIVLPNIDSSTIKMMLETSKQFENICFPMIGLHPTSVKEDFEEELEVVEYWLNKEKFYGIGEVGIDLYWDDTFRKEQELVFTRQLKLAQKYNLPLSIHIRESFDIVYELVKKNRFDGMKGIFHCFTGNTAQAKSVIDLGFKIGVGGIVTFKNSGIDKMVAQLKPDDIVLETDAPYLAPTPFRGKRNESSYLVYVLSKVSAIFGISENEMADLTTKTACTVFDI
ncbi:MAG: TatD family hydrolase [Prolixibacteraceae bacterium]|nr:TatD family hydrolase [Prolixibacteraceae bacterium]